jgi:hypothetical protein
VSEPYNAFISYSHTSDREIAIALERSSERFAKPWYRRRQLRVFRDETGLSTNPGLWTSVRSVLDQSQWLIVLASPAAAKSRWVNQEIAHFHQTHGPDRIMAVVADGEWVWDHRRGGFDMDLSTAVPTALASAFSEEPRHLDVRWVTTPEDVISATHSSVTRSPSWPPHCTG